MNLATISSFANMCGTSNQNIRRRIKIGDIVPTKMKPVMLIDIEKYQYIIDYYKNKQHIYIFKLRDGIIVDANDQQVNRDYVMELIHRYFQDDLQGKEIIVNLALAKQLKTIL